MTRRELIQKTTMALGYTLSGSTLMGIMSGCEPKREAGFVPAFFNEELALVIADLAEAILPRTTTPGAKDVGVPVFIDNFVREIYSKADQDKFLSDLDEFNKGGGSKKFSESSSAEQKQYAEVVHSKAMVGVGPISEGWWNTAKSERPFILKMKELTILGFFTSKQGASEVLQYNQSPGPYRGCVPLKEVGKAWAT
jgi:gluconate 2-dehydrogenase gamma chain